MAVHGEQWCTIESDPGVFTELIAEIGVKDVQVEELWSFDAQTLEKLQPVHGLVFLFKWRPEEDNRPIDRSYDMNELFFANQVINNACATQAILSILLNRKNIDIGDMLREFKEFAQLIPADMKGLAIGNCEKIRIAHNGFARPEPLISDGTHAPSGRDDDVYHFISYLPINGKLYELDGLKEGPICLGSCTEENWLEKVTPEIQKRIDRYSQSEIRFNLMALIKKLKTKYSEQGESIQVRKQAIQAKIQSIKESGVNSMEIEDGLPNTLEELQNELVLLESSLSEIQSKIQDEDDKLERWKIENTRRKHNYIPFIVNFLKYLAEQDQLLPLIENS